MMYSEYRLVYFRKTDGRKFYLRRVSAQEYRIIDSETHEKKEITYYQLKKEFELDPQNFEKIKELTQVRVC